MNERRVDPGQTPALGSLDQLDLAGPGYGARLSGAAWYDTVYNKTTANPGFAGGAVDPSTSLGRIVGRGSGPSLGIHALPLK